MEAALFGGIAELSRFDAMDADDKLQLLAFRRVKMKMRAWEDHLQAEEFRKQRGENKV